MIIEIGYSATDEEPQHEGYYKSIENAKKALDNLEKTLNPLTIKPLTENDRPAVQALDELSNDYVEQWLEDNEDYAWGAFLDRSEEHTSELQSLREISRMPSSA